jgi:hypothetical protein
LRFGGCSLREARLVLAILGDRPDGGGDLGGEMCQWRACEVEDEMILTIAFLGMGEMGRDSRMGAAKLR